MQTQTSLVLARQAHASELLFTIFLCVQDGRKYNLKCNENFSWSNEYVFLSSEMHIISEIIIITLAYNQ